MTSVQRASMNVGGSGGTSAYIAPQEPEKHDEQLKVSKSSELNDAVEQSGKDSETLTNAIVIEHTYEEDPVHKEVRAGNEKDKGKEPKDEDGPSEGGAGEKNPINKYYKWWS